MSREPSRAWLTFMSVCFLTLCTGTCVAFKYSLRSAEDEEMRADLEGYARTYATAVGLDAPQVVRSWTGHGAPWGLGPPRFHWFDVEGKVRKTGQPGRVRIEWSIARHDWTRLN